MKGNRDFFVCFIFCTVVINIYARGVDNNTQSTSQQKCKEYEAIVKNLTNQQCFKPPTSTTADGNGDPVDAREFPHVVALGYEDTNKSIIYLCGGIIISKNFVLTAAQCLFSRGYGAPKLVTVGDLVLNSDKDKDIARPENIKILKSFRHPDFKAQSKYDDIGLLELEKDIPFSMYAYPACLPEFPDIEDLSKVGVAGWEYKDPSASISLLFTNLRIVPHAACSHYYKPVRTLTEGISNETHICAATVQAQERKDPCNVSSGAPLQRLAKKNCIYEILGITSFGKACILSVTPGVYTKVYPYLGWIESIVWP